MDDSFDPYLQWLGIRDAERPPNHYRLLGVAQLESDTDVISNAADRQMAHVRTFQTGKYSDVSQRVLNELAKAKVCLLKADRKAAYDKRLAEKLAAVQAGQAESATTQSAMNPTRTAEPAAAPQAGNSGFAGVAVGSAPSRPRSMADRAGWGSSKKTNKPLLLSAAILLFGIGVIIAVVVAVNLAGPDKDSSVKVDDTDATNDPDGKTKPSQPNQTKEIVGKTNGPPKKVIQKPEPPQLAAWPWQPREPKTAADRQAPPLKLSALVLKSLRAARRAMQERDLDQADEYIKSAAASATTTEEKGEVDRHGKIRSVLMSYWNAVDAGLSKAAAGDTLTYREAEVTIVSVGGGVLKLKAENGAEKSFDTDRDKIEFALAHALAQDRLKELGPEGWVALGAATAVNHPGDIKLAEGLWLRAHKQNTDITAFVNEVKFDFSKLEAAAIVALPAARKVVPSSSDRSTAAKQIKGKLFGGKMRQAKTAEEKLRLAGEMLSEAENPKNDDAMRYELFEQGIGQLVQAGALDEARRAIDELAKTFEVDRVERTAAAMIAMAKVDRVFDREAATTFVDELGQFAYQAALLDKSVAASALIGAAKTLTKRLEPRAARHKPLTKHLSRFSKFFGALKNLKKKDDNPIAHLTIGEFQCYVMGDWERGLKHLAKGSDKPLSELAQDDLASPKDEEAQLALGDRWWEFHNKIPTKSRQFERVGVGRRTKHWYEASPGLGGDVKRQGRKQILERLAAEIEQLDVVASDGLNLLAGRRWDERGVWGPVDGALYCKVIVRGTPYPVTMFNVTPTGSYKLDIEFKRLPIDKVNKWPGYLIVCLPTPGSYCALTVNCADKGSNYNGIDDSPKPGDRRLGGIAYHPGIGKKHRLQVSVTPTPDGKSVKIEATLNGKPITRWTGPSSALKGTGKLHKVSGTRNIGVGASSGGIKFYKVNFSGRHKGG